MQSVINLGDTLGDEYFTVICMDRSQGCFVVSKLIFWADYVCVLEYFDLASHRTFQNDPDFWFLFKYETAKINLIPFPIGKRLTIWLLTWLGPGLIDILLPPLSLQEAAQQVKRINISYLDPKIFNTYISHHFKAVVYNFSLLILRSITLYLFQPLK